MNFREWRIPRRVLQLTESAFTGANHEVFAMWTSPLSVTSDTCRIERCVVPKQTPGITETGVYVHIEGRELSRIQFDNYDRGERSVIQLHTHPGSDVTMSELDREWEVVRHAGALSIIVPLYCQLGLDGFPGVNVYERLANEWKLWNRPEVIQRLRIVP